MKLYKEILSVKDNTVSYFHIDVTQEMQQIWGKEIVEKALIISPKNATYSEKGIDNFFETVKKQWESNIFDSKNVCIYHGWYNFAIWFTNGKVCYIDKQSQTFKTSLV